jgi:hypothetical protein
MTRMGQKFTMVVKGAWLTRVAAVASPRHLKQRTWVQMTSLAGAPYVELIRAGISCWNRDGRLRAQLICFLFLPFLPTSPRKPAGLAFDLTYWEAETILWNPSLPHPVPYPFSVVHFSKKAGNGTNQRCFDFCLGVLIRSQPLHDCMTFVSCILKVTVNVNVLLQVTPSKGMYSGSLFKCVFKSFFFRCEFYLLICYSHYL